ncbi:Di-copper centre-containing protein [Rhizoclosmatium globosum]|uniref:Di-copper centre-containing protein n=1 Tax=Rhizoclosmatium globosum TaxID=329046 RepID=A0A1Y2C902_9FUNG|nr:Di-copper centre-containing protein [Rhizoclosmatium globosum]|eukprot:ORY42805.1 Di-copper centre-containing protein [Rhizoclosmatium globosum]
MIAILVAVLVAFVDAACTNPRIRSEWGQLTAEQKATYVRAVQVLRDRPASGQYSDPSRMGWHDFTITHSREAFWSHGNAQFYPYHRAMLWQYENALISTGIWPSNMGVPYFDWSAMSQNWWTSDIFTDQYFGAISSNDPNTCVLTGAFAKGKYSVAADADGHRIVTGDQTCLRRNAQQSALPDATSIVRGLAARSFEEFHGHNLDESNFHASGHGTLGGVGSDLGNPSVSPNDPVFYFHHGFVDKFYWKWQNQCEFFKHDYQGRLARADDPVGNGTIYVSKELFVNSWPFQVKQLLDTQGDTLCYTYSQSGGDLQTPRVDCPAFNPDETKTDSSQTSSTASTSATGLPTGADDFWVTKMLISLVARKPISFKPSNNVSAAIMPIQENVVHFRRENEIPVDGTAAGYVETPLPSKSETTKLQSTISASAITPSVSSIIQQYNETSSTNATSTKTTITTNATLTTNSTAATTVPDESNNKTENFINTVSSTASIQQASATTTYPTTNTTMHDHTNLNTTIPKTYNETKAADNTTIISFSFKNSSIEVPSGYDVVEVYTNSVTAVDQTGTPKRFFQPMPVVEYVPNPDAPRNVEVGSDPCFLAYPEQLSCSYIEAMGMSCDMYLNSYNKGKMAIDAFNADGCKTMSSPSSLMNWQV